MGSRAGLALLLGALLAGCQGDPAQTRLGLFTTLPIYWTEQADIAGMLRENSDRHWARRLIEQDHVLVPLDTLLEEGKLRGLKSLLLAQPRALSPQENVSLDRWVRDGGRLLLFADPMLTEHSGYALGDGRRPHGAALLTPILKRWGLSFSFDDGQSDQIRMAELFGAKVPVELAGRFDLMPGGSCALLEDGLAAQCRIGRGHALIIADAALLDADARPGPWREPALAALMSQAFAR